MNFTLFLIAAFTAVNYGACNGIACPEIYAPVCGSDGRTYSSRCVLEGAQQQGNSDLIEVHHGPCMPFECSKRSQKGDCYSFLELQMGYNPVCGFDGRTYDNPCVFCYNQYIIVQNGGQLYFLHMGEC